LDQRSDRNVGPAPKIVDRRERIVGAGRDDLGAVLVGQAANDFSHLVMLADRP
jgi:hypothetical protein